MGGAGSGRRWGFSAKCATVEMPSIDVRSWARADLLRPGTHFSTGWRRFDEKTATLHVQAMSDRLALRHRRRTAVDEWRERHYVIGLGRTPCNFGGSRVWFICPARGCGRRAAILYGGALFACRRCYDLAYPSQREDAIGRAIRRGAKIRAKLGWEHSPYDRDWLKPKGMHWRTFERLSEQHDWIEGRALQLTMRRFMR